MPIRRLPNLQNSGSIRSQNLGEYGVIDTNSIIEANSERFQTLEQLRNEFVDYIRLRLGDQIVDVELDKEHYELAIKQALVKYRQRAQNATEESYVFLDLLPETQEYVLPDYIQEVRKVFRRGIGSVTGTTASQFEPFASGYLNTYMLVAGRVGGLVNYELFTQYQELAMKMFGGHINYTWNRVTKKLSIVRKMPGQTRDRFSVASITADGTQAGSTITIVLSQPKPVVANDLLIIRNCPNENYNEQYVIQTVSEDSLTITVTALNNLGFASVTGADLEATFVHSPQIDGYTESVLLWVYNTKPDEVLLADPMVRPWLQEYSLAFAKTILGQARGKFGSVAGPQGAGQLNGASLLQEAQAEMERLEEELKRFYDGSMPYTWITG